MLLGTLRQGHSVLCCRRMEEDIRTSPKGQVRVSHQKERENERNVENIARKAEEKNTQSARNEARGKEERDVRREGMQRRIERHSSRGGAVRITVSTLHPLPPHQRSR